MGTIICVLAVFVQIGLAVGVPTVHLGRAAIVGRENFVQGLPLQEFFGGASRSPLVELFYGGI